MKLFKHISKILSMPLLVACAQAPTENSLKAAHTVRQETLASTVSQRTKNSQTDISLTEGTFPNIALTPDLLFGIVASEIAAQRGAAGASALAYLDLARKTQDPRLAQRTAELALFSGQLEVANKALQLWVQIEPSSTIAREQLLVTLLRLGELSQCYALIEELAKQDPARLPALFVQMARLVSYQKNKVQAYQLVRDLAERYASLPEAQFALIATAAEIDDAGTVDKAFDRLAIVAPKWDLPVAWQTERLSRRNTKEAITFLKRELARRPEAGYELKLAYPKLLLTQKQFVEARAAFENLLRDYPHSPDLLYACGLLAYQLKDLSAAKLRLEAALQEKHHQRALIHFILGQLAEEQDQLDEARRWYEGVDSGAQYFAAQTRLAYLDAESGKLDRALSRLATLGSTEDERIQSALFQAQLARNARRYDLALKAINTAFQAYPDAPELWYEGALLAELTGDVGNAELKLRRYLKEKPNDPMGLNALGYTLANHTTRHREALSFIKRALRMEPNNPMILDSMGWVQFKLGQYQVALTYLARAYDMLQDPEIAAHYGEVLWMLGRYDEAQKIWSQAKQFAPTNEVLNSTLQRLLGL